MCKYTLYPSILEPIKRKYDYVRKTFRRESTFKRIKIMYENRDQRKKFLLN